MRIVIDLQGDQSTGSRGRGIGRYSLSIAQAIARNRGNHEIFIALSSAFPASIDPIRSSFAGLLPPENVRIWNSIESVNYGNIQNSNRRKAAEKVREAFLHSLLPDVIYVASLFEGFEDDAVTSIHVLGHGIPTVTTLYDLIPYIHRDQYLLNPNVSAWYSEKVEFLRKSSVLLAISNSARNDAIEHLKMHPDSVFNIAAAADPHFKPVTVDDESRRELFEKYGLVRPYVMYTGGIDHRKNIEGLIRAYAMLPEQLRRQHQLAVVCSVKQDARALLARLALAHGLMADELVLTDFVSEEELVHLYNLSKAFVFPSKYEGFGLPALEAMSCGIPTIASNCSSLPEIIGRDDALFDPHSDQSISSKLNKLLIDHDFRQDLATSGAERSRLFSWDKSAKLAIQAFEKVLHKNNKFDHIRISPKRLRLAYISPLPPERTGIADYSADLVSALLVHYELTLITPQKVVDESWMIEKLPVHTPEWLLEHRSEFDRVLYHLGNSDYHSHMFDMLEELAGVVVMHDFFLSGIFNHLEMHGYHQCWSKHIFDSHGYPALVEKLNHKNSDNSVWKYPANVRILNLAKGVISHSRCVAEMIDLWYGNYPLHHWAVIPLIKSPPKLKRKDQTKEVLGIREGTFLVCSFGMLGPTKLNHRLVDAWIGSSLAHNPEAMLVFVGQNDGGKYGQELMDLIRRNGLSDQVRITGWTSPSDFSDYLAAADLGVQLRTNSRGETSAAVLDCMNYGLPVIANANGSMAELDSDATLLMPDVFADDDLVEALESLYSDVERRERMSCLSKLIVQSKHDPAACSRMYRDVIEDFYKTTPCQFQDLIFNIAKVDSDRLTERDIIDLSCSIARNNVRKVGLKSLFVDVSELHHIDTNTQFQTSLRGALKNAFENPPAGFRIEPVYIKRDEGVYYYARNFSFKFLECNTQSIYDDRPIDFKYGDIFLVSSRNTEGVEQNRFIETMCFHGVSIQVMEYCSKGVFRFPDQ